MCSHEIAPRALSLHLAEPRIARATRLGFCCIRPEVQLSQVEWKFVRCREVPNHQTDYPAIRLNTMVRMRHHELEPKSRCHTGEQVEQCYGIGTTRNGNDRSAPPGCAKQARALHVLEK